MTAVYILLIILMVGIMLLIPQALQFRNGINPERFPKIKVNKLGFMFRGIGGHGGAYTDVKEYGVICPMFAIQVLGYTLALLTVIIAPVVAAAAEMTLEQTVFIVLYMLVAEAVICVITTIVCLIISTQLDKKLAV